jgi:glutathione peroxidase-family protein
MRRTVVFTDDYYEKLKAVAKKLGITVAAVIQLACNQFLAENLEK